MEQLHGKSEILTIMFIDLAGYTKTTAKLSREELNELHEAFDGLVLPVFSRYSGNVIKKIGDAFLVTFSSATDAVWCGIEIQNKFAEYNKSKPRYHMNIRVVLHTGEILHRQGDIYGDAVNTAARIEGVAHAGDIVFSETVFLSMNNEEIPFVYIGPVKLKGLKYPVKLFRVKGVYEDMIRRRKKLWKGFKSFVEVIVLIAVLCGILYLIYWLLKSYGYLIGL